MAIGGQSFLPGAASRKISNVRYLDLSGIDEPKSQRECRLIFSRFSGRWILDKRSRSADRRSGRILSMEKEEDF